MSTKTASPHLILQKPVSVLNKPLKADVPGLFKALAKAAKDGFTGKWDELAPDLDGARLDGANLKGTILEHLMKPAAVARPQSISNPQPPPP